MTHFLIVYKRSTGTLLSLESFDERGDATQRRLELEIRQSSLDCEVVMLTAPTIEALKRTHSRYFRSLKEVVSDLHASTEAANA